HIYELEVREDIFQAKLQYYEDQYEIHKISSTTYEDQKMEIEDELSEIASLKRYWRTGKESSSSSN
ncbi:MAG: hypothetical protein ACTSV2_12815, partial [Candidatus Thorarchaeota archaeon]